MNPTRRGFLTDVGSGMLLATVGPSLAGEMGLCRAFGDEPGAGLTFGGLEPLVDLMQETAPETLLPIVVEKLRSGTDLKQLVAAAALANARAFGGEDYIGFHTLMAMAPAYQMAHELPADRRAMPILKVLYRNAARLQEQGGAALHTLTHVHATPPSPGQPGGEALRDAVRRKSMGEAEGIYAALAGGPAQDALDALLPTAQDATEVHRVVLVWRAWSLLDIVGQEQAHTMLRQSVHYCVNGEPKQAEYNAGLRAMLPRLFDQHKLLGKPIGNRTADDAWVEKISQTLFTSTAEQGAEAIAAALAEGFGPEPIGQAVAMTANQLVLRDPGRPEKWSSLNKPAGSVHGDSVGVHTCDAVNAWCNIARVANARNAMASLMLAGYEVARDRTQVGHDLGTLPPRPLSEDAAKVNATDAASLLKLAEEAIEGNDQSAACAAIARYGQEGHAPRPVFDLMLRYAVSEDGALHAEKYYQTVTEEFARAREPQKWAQLVALARVTASAHGYPAPGYEQAKELLKV